VLAGPAAVIFLIIFGMNVHSAMDCPFIKSVTVNRQACRENSNESRRSLEIFTRDEKMESIMDRHHRKKRFAVLITGSTSDLGAAFADLFASKGRALVLVSTSARRLERQCREIESQYRVSTLPIVCDLSDPWSPEENVERIQRHRWQIDILVNNAGFNASGRFTQTNLGYELKMIEAHVGATTSLTKRLLPAMIEQGAGRILNVGSFGSLAPCPGNAVYGATKAYVLNFSDALAAELVGSGVTITTLLPETKHAAVMHPGSTREWKRIARIAFRGLMRGSRRVVPGFHNRLIMMAAPFSPRCFRSWVAGRIGCRQACPDQSVAS